MSLTALDVTTAQLSPPELPLDGGGSANTDPLQLKNIDGLGPVNASVNTQSLAKIDGAFFTGANVSFRNIVLTFCLNPNWDDQTNESLRQLLYAYFMPKAQTTLVFRSTHLPDVGIDGIVESMEPNIFAKDPEYKVSIICPRPDFVALAESTASGTIGTASSFRAVTVSYEGTVKTGFLLRARSTRGAYTGALSILTRTLVQSGFTGSGTIDVTNDVRFSSVQGDKYIRQVVVATGVITNLLRTTTIGAGWPVLEPGDTELLVIATTADAFKLWDISYFARYGGL